MMRLPSIFAALLGMLLMCLVSSPDGAPSQALPLLPEQYTTLHVSQMAVLTIPADRRYDEYAQSEASVGGAWDNVLKLVQHSKRKFTFRALRPGSAVLILSPNTTDGECISCATIHYFVNVAPDGGSAKL